MQGKIAAGAALVFLYRLIDRSLGIVSTLVLARLLMPEDFGLVAMAAAVIAVIELTTAFGFELALVQHRDPKRVHYDTAWTLNISISGAAALVVCALAWPAAWFFKEPRVVEIMLFSALTMFVGGFENVGTVNFRRAMDFKRDFAFLGGKRLIGFIATICASLALHSYWGLLIGALVQRFAGIALSYAMQPYRPRLALGAWRELYHFSRWTLLSNVLIAGLQRAPHFAVGRIFGGASLGHYVIASDVGGMPTTELAAPLNRSSIPGYARLQDDRAALRATFGGVNGLLALIVFPAGIGLALVARPTVEVLLGHRWIDAVPLMQVLSCAGIAVALGSNYGSLCIAVGKPKLNMMLLALRLTCLIIGLMVLPRWLGVVGAAWAELVAASVSLVAGLIVVRREIELTIASVLGQWWRPALASAAMTAAVLPTLAWADRYNDYIQLVVGITAGAVAYSLALGGLWVLAGRPSGAESQLVAQFRARLAGFRGPSG